MRCWIYNNSHYTIWRISITLYHRGTNTNSSNLWRHGPLLKHVRSWHPCPISTVFDGTYFPVNALTGIAGSARMWCYRSLFTYIIYNANTTVWWCNIYCDAIFRALPWYLPSSKSIWGYNARGHVAYICMVQFFFVQIPLNSGKYFLYENVFKRVTSQTRYCVTETMGQFD